MPSKGTLSLDVSKGVTPVLSSEEATALLEGMGVSTVVGLRDRAIIAVMTYTFARVGAVVALNVEALNHSVKDLPADRMRMHVCWGSTLGPHHGDVRKPRHWWKAQPLRLW